MTSAAEEIADKIATLGLGTVGVDIFIGVYPEKPDVITSVFESGGSAPDLGFGCPGLKYEYPSIQVVCRGERGDYDGPRQRIHAIYTGLAQVQGQTLGSTYYHLIKPMQAPSHLRRDDDARVLMDCNFRCEKEVSA